MSPSQAAARRWSQRTAVIVAAIAGAAFLPAGAQAMQIEQISRADGVAGASPIELHRAPGVVSDDGATAYVSFSQDWGTWTTATGLWRRDIATNRSTQVLGGTGHTFAGFGAGQVVGVRTARRLVSTDTNNAQDLYTYDGATGRFDLVSRIGSGPATGLSGSAFLTRDGRSALFTAPAGAVHRRDLATGQTVKVADGGLGSSEREGSADGTVFVTETGVLVSPGRTDDVATADTFNRVVAVSPDGKRAVVTAKRNSDRVAIGFQIDIATGARTAFDPAALGTDARVVGFSDDGRALVARATSATSFEVIGVTLPSGASTRVAAYGAPITSLQALSRSGRFAVFTGNGPNFVASSDGVNLPGGADLPSPGIYAVAFAGCRNSGFPWYRPAQAPFLVRGAFGLSYLPRISSLALRVTNTSGALLSSSVLSGDGVGTFPTLPNTASRLTATATYPDGRTTTETWSILGPTSACGA